MKSRKLLSLLAAVLTAALLVPNAFAAEKSETPAASAAPGGEAVSTTEETASEKGEVSPAEEDSAPAEGETAPAEEDSAPAEKENVPTEDEAAPSDDRQLVTIPLVERKFAARSASAVLVNGEPASLDAYAIDGYTYFKLRDLAAAVAGTSAAFNVSWNEEAACIELTAGTAYEQTEGGLAAGNGKETAAASSTQMPVLLNGERIELSGYLIGESTYFQLRDLGGKLGFTVGWNAVSKSISIETGEPEAPETPAEAPETPAQTPETPAEAPETPAEVPEAPAGTPETSAEASEAPAEAPETPAEAPGTSADASESGGAASEPAAETDSAAPTAG